MGLDKDLRRNRSLGFFRLGKKEAAEETKVKQLEAYGMG
jgi:hypothetical protein